MNTNTLNGKWNEIKGMLMKKYGELTNDDFAGAKGDIDALLGVVERKTGVARDDIENFVHKSLDNAGSLASSIANTTSKYASEANDQLRQSYDRVSGAVQQGYDRSQELVQQGYSKSQEMIQRSPMESMAIAFGVGAMTGLLAVLLMQSSTRR
jgi:uncharacterized protein YjbJ (UPF0337 family)